MAALVVASQLAPIERRRLFCAHFCISREHSVFSCWARGPEPNPSQSRADNCTSRTSGEIDKLRISPWHPYLCDFKDGGVKGYRQHYNERLGTFVVSEC